ncbi:MAG: ATP-binding protein [Longimicrobiales bacterium]
MTVRTRLLLTIFGIALLLTLPAAYGATQLANLRDIADQQREQHGTAFLAAGQLQAALASLDRYVRGYIAVGGADQYIGIEQSLADARRALEVLRERGYETETRLAGQRFDAVDQATRHILSLVSAGKRSDATTYFESVKPLLLDASASLEAIANAVDARSREALVTAAEISGGARNTTLAALLAALAAVFIIGWWTTRTITTPVRRLRGAMANVAAGSYVVPQGLPYGRTDEIGDLARSFSWMTQHLARLDKMKAEFMSIATHELKTPINVITGYTELVDEGVYGELTEGQRDALQAIRDQAHGLTRLVNQLLDVSRLEAGGLHLSMRVVVTEDLFESLERSFTILAQEKNITLTFAEGGNVPRTIYADPDRLRDQVLGNLLSNALKFTPVNGHVGVRIWGDDDVLRVEVSDTGVGMSPEELPYVFDKYYQIGQEARSQGAGLGLAIAREVVEAHAGQITVESIENVGTTFRIELPTRQSTAVSDEVPAIVGAEPDHR